MPTYKYKVRDKFGKLLKGVIGSDSRQKAAEHLEKMGYVPIFISEKKESTIEDFFESFDRVNREDLNLFTRQMVTLIKAGVPMLSSLRSVEQQTTSKPLKKVIQQLIKDLEAGNSFSDALLRQPRTFDKLYVNTVRAGEVSGMLDEVLDRLADLGEHEADTIAKIKTATRYPLLSLCVLFMAFAIMTVFVLPRFVRLFKSMKVELPLPTMIMIKLNYVTQHYWYIVILAIAALSYAFYRFVKTDKGRFIWDSIKLKMPVFGKLFNILIMSRFSRTMAIMIKSGVPILDVLEIAGTTSGNAVIEHAIISIRDGVKEGKQLAEPMKISGVFSPLVLQMIAIGEETGKLDELLLRISEYYDRQSEYLVKNLSTLIEPIFILIIAGGVIFLALAVFLPMWNMYGAMASH